MQQSAMEAKASSNTTSAGIRRRALAVSIAMSIYPRLHTVADVLIVSGLVATVLMAIHVFVGREAAWIIALTTLVFALVACFTPRGPV